MATITFAGTIDARVRKDQWTEQARRIEGQDVIAKDNTLMSTKNPATEKRVIDCQISLFDETEEATFRATVQAGFPVIITGDLIVGTLVGYVTIGAVQYRKWDAAGTTFRRWMNIHIDEE